MQANKKEEFDYDGLYRMTQSRLFATAGGTTPSATDNYSYDSLGNLTNKGGAAGAYTYANYNYGTRTGCADTVVRPHAVYQVTVGTATRRYCYDANGNLTAQSIASGTGTTKYDSSTWWVANLARRVSQNLASTYSDFWYGPGRERIRQFAQKSATTTENTLYVGGLYEKLTRTVSGTPRAGGTMSDYKMLKANDVGRDFVVGDVHGMFDRSRWRSRRSTSIATRDRREYRADLPERCTRATGATDDPPEGMHRYWGGRARVVRLLPAAGARIGPE